MARDDAVVVLEGRLVVSKMRAAGDGETSILQQVRGLRRVRLGVMRPLVELLSEHDEGHADGSEDERVRVAHEEQEGEEGRHGRDRRLVEIVARLSMRNRPRTLVVALEGLDLLAPDRSSAVAIVVHRPVVDAAPEVRELVASSESHDVSQKVQRCRGEAVHHEASLDQQGDNHERSSPADHAVLLSAFKYVATLQRLEVGCGRST
mmetsp:Transcript_5578/g.12142  ORF Transcript_5578/g.12142 Transcript_5578/m.12142 type:complete len:206 (+) Transcript_5578:494-1111(+)